MSLCANWIIREVNVDPVCVRGVGLTRGCSRLGRRRIGCVKKFHGED